MRSLDQAIQTVVRAETLAPEVLTAPPSACCQDCFERTRRKTRRMVKTYTWMLSLDNSHFDQRAADWCCGKCNRRKQGYEPRFSFILACRVSLSPLVNFSGLSFLICKINMLLSRVRCPTLIETLPIKIHWEKHPNVTPKGGNIITKPLLIIHDREAFQNEQNQSPSPAAEK